MDSRHSLEEKKKNAHMSALNTTPILRIHRIITIYAVVQCIVPTVGHN